MSISKHGPGLLPTHIAILTELHSAPAALHLRELNARIARRSGRRSVQVWRELLHLHRNGYILLNGPYSRISAVGAEVLEKREQEKTDVIA